MGSRYVYQIDAPGGIDVNATYGSSSPFPDEEEISFPGGIRTENNKGVYDTVTRQFIPNPNYAPNAP